MDGKCFSLTSPHRPHISQKSKLQAEGLDNEAALDETIKKLEADLKKARKKEAGEADDGQEEPTFPLVDIPDADVRSLLPLISKFSPKPCIK